MVTRIGGARRKTRQVMTKGYRQKGKISISKYFQQLEKDDRVVIKPEPAYQKSICHKRYFGKIAQVSKKQGDCYEVILSVNRKPKKIIIHPVHLSKVK